ncbi:MAG: polysaccharide biosynthesis C-terminal domain-containing protein [Bryobacterales bacterium]|nr:polysaccharide biosynthesis C-terminal domain-containing protein [Bryobacterales bacterium]
MTGQANLGRKVVGNTVAQVAGRGLIALSRLAVASVIVRGWGKATFGEYSLLFVILTISEWVLDFGTTEIFVRDVCANRQRETGLLKTLTAAKLLQLPAAFVVLAAVLLVMRYPSHIVEAGLSGGLGLIFYSGVLIYHTVFKANLSIHLEVAAELLSVVLMIVLVWMASHWRVSLAVLMACHVVSRATFFAICAWLGRKQFRLTTLGLNYREAWSSLRTSSAVGLIGLLVVGYEALDMLALSKLSTPADLAYYSAAQRLIWPIVMALSSVGATLYPLVASYWPHDRAGFEVASQRALNIVILLACAGACCALASPVFLMGLLGPDLVEGATALRIFAVLLVIKAVTATMGPVLYILHAQRQALRFIAVAVVVKAAIVLAVAPRYGYIGVAVAAVLVETLFAAAPTIAILQSRSGYRVRWGVPARLVACAGLIAAVVGWLLPSGGLASGVAAALLYSPLALLSGAINMSDFRSLLARKAT